MDNNEKLKFSDEDSRFYQYNMYDDVPYVRNPEICCAKNICLKSGNVYKGNYYYSPSPKNIDTN